MLHWWTESLRWHYREEGEPLESSIKELLPIQWFLMAPGHRRTWKAPLDYHLLCSLSWALLCWATLGKALKGTECILGGEPKCSKWFNWTKTNRTDQVLKNMAVVSLSLQQIMNQPTQGINLLIFQLNCARCICPICKSDLWTGDNVHFTHWGHSSCCSISVEIKGTDFVLNQQPKTGQPQGIVDQ